MNSIEKDVCRKKGTMQNYFDSIPPKLFAEIANNMNTAELFLGRPTESQAQEPTIVCYVMFQRVSWA